MKKLVLISFAMLLIITAANAQLVQRTAVPAAARSASGRQPVVQKAPGTQVVARSGTGGKIGALSPAPVLSGFRANNESRATLSVTSVIENPTGDEGQTPTPINTSGTLPDGVLAEFNTMNECVIWLGANAESFLGQRSLLSFKCVKCGGGTCPSGPSGAGAQARWSNTPWAGS
ncbi:MAG: hypothetical protein FWG39_04050 [Alphaproteobacteria bacterium]|nr:hypothetical protein [Alphaproteobacteria bacterium]